MKKEYYPVTDNFYIEKSKKVQVKDSMDSIHYHNNYEIYYQLEGERNYFIDDRIYYVKKGDLVIINKNSLHRTIYSGNPSYERILLYFYPNFINKIYGENINDLLQPFKDNKKVLRLNIEKQLFIENITKKMFREYYNNYNDSNLYLKILLTELLLNIKRYIKITEIVNHPSSLHEQVSNYVKYINNNYYRNIKVSDIAKHFHISRSYLSKIFKDITDFTLVEYINHVRIKEAQKLLISTDYNIIKISQKAGFNNHTHFGRVFKKKTGISPLKYRKINKCKY